MLAIFLGLPAYWLATSKVGKRLGQSFINVAALTDLDVRQCFYEAYLEIKDRRGEMRSDGIFYKEA